MSENKMLLVDCCNSGGFVLDLNESTDRGLTKFKGKFQEAEAVNKNKRMYPYGAATGVSESKATPVPFERFSAGPRPVSGL